MFKKIFGGHGGGGGGSSSSAAPKKVSAAKSQENTTNVINAIQQLQDASDLAIKRRDLLEKKIAAELQRAREANAAKNKRGAILALKKKKLLEGQLATAENNIQRLTEQQMMLEEQSSSLNQIKVMQAAAKTSKQTMQELDIDNVDKIMGEINEQSDQMASINDALSQPLGGAAIIDEDDLEAELEELNAQDLDEQLLEPAPVPSTRIQSNAQPAQPARQGAEQHAALPSVPTRKAPAKTPEELELEQLEAEMAG